TTAARVIAVDTREEARRHAVEHGADLALPSDDATADAVRDATGGRGAGVVLAFAGVDAPPATAAASARMLGDVTIVGIGGGTLPVSFFSVPYEVSLQTTYWGTRPELAEVLDMGARGLLRPDVTEFPLDRAMDAYRDMEAGRLTGRAVIVPA